ncbi:response regulator [Bacillus solimangrovi]|uniref:DNA-binding response regulator n=1 Tax=Bacillus solimangrovi TaxID=1305675 RepID=A0A1E5LFC8_9BACI|nr:response regulator transcription factor [Bacillus solimangrovi]OEH92795.1 DNA-binding response regulator [Bacillus solimangrovi]
MNILLIDDHTLFAKSLEIVFEDYEEIKSLKLIQNVDNIKQILEGDKPDILLIDINLSNISDEDGIILSRLILNDYPKIKIIILTGYDLPVYRHEAKKAGVKGFVNKNILPDQLLRILIKVNSGYEHFPTKEEEYICELTESEIRILRLLSEGYKRETIAEKLYISKRTVSNHIQNIFSKFQVSSSLEAVAKGIKFGYIQNL